MFSHFALFFFFSYFRLTDFLYIFVVDFYFYFCCTRIQAINSKDTLSSADCCLAAFVCWSFDR